MKAELKRKDDLLNDTRRKVAGFEQTLKSVNSSLEFQMKARNEMSNLNYVPIDPQLNPANQANPQFVSNPNPNSIPQFP